MAEKSKSEKWKGARTRNLTASQQESAKRIVGGGKTERVSAQERKAAQKSIDIGQTKWTTAKERGGKGVGGLLTDASGKAVTGTVTLPSGKKATYVRGKRIGVVGGRGGSTGGSDGSTDGKTIKVTKRIITNNETSRRLNARGQRQGPAIVRSTSRRREADAENRTVKRMAGKQAIASQPKRTTQTQTTRTEATKTPLRRMAEEQAARWKRSEQRSMVNNPNARTDWAAKGREREAGRAAAARPRVGQTRTFRYGRGSEVQTYRANGKWEVTSMWKNGKKVPVPASRRWSD